MLLEEMPVIPVIFNVDAYMVGGGLSKVGDMWFGMRDFTDTKLANYAELKPGYEELGY